VTPKQTTLYWRQWATVCEFMGWKNSDSARRYALHKEAGCPASMKEFGNKDLDAYLKFCASITGHIDKRDRERERLIWRINDDARRGNLAPEYLKLLARDIYGLGCWEELATEDLEKFVKTVRNRSSRHVAKEAQEAKPSMALAECPF